MITTLWQRHQHRWNQSNRDQFVDDESIGDESSGELFTGHESSGDSVVMSPNRQGELR
jgi:hypothetical protein